MEPNPSDQGCLLRLATGFYRIPGPWPVNRFSGGLEPPRDLTSCRHGVKPQRARTPPSPRHRILPDSWFRTSDRSNITSNQNPIQFNQTVIHPKPQVDSNHLGNLPWHRKNKHRWVRTSLENSPPDSNRIPGPRPVAVYPTQVTIQSETIINTETKRKIATLQEQF